MVDGHSWRSSRHAMEKFYRWRIPLRVYGRLERERREALNRPAVPGVDRPPPLLGPVQLLKIIEAARGTRVRLPQRLRRAHGLRQRYGWRLHVTAAGSPFKSGDIILDVNRRVVHCMADLRWYLASCYYMDAYIRVLRDEALEHIRVFVQPSVQQGGRRSA